MGSSKGASKGEMSLASHWFNGAGAQVQETPISSSWTPWPLSPTPLPLLSKKIYWQGETRLTKLRPWTLQASQECFDPPLMPSSPQPIVLPNTKDPREGWGPCFPSTSGRCVLPAGRGRARALWGWRADLGSAWHPVAQVRPHELSSTWCIRSCPSTAPFS